MIRSLWRSAALALLFGAAFAAQAQTYPNRPVRVIVGYPPGGSVDALMRQIAPPLGTRLGQPVVLENRAGGGGVVAGTTVAKGPADGYTMLAIFDSFALLPALHSDLTYDTRRELAPLMLVARMPYSIVAHPSTPYQSLADVVAAAKGKPGAVTHGSSGTATLGHLLMLAIQNQAGIEFTHVPYRGGGPALQDALAGHIPIYLASSFLLNPHVKAGKLRLLAVTSRERYAQAPEARTAIEQGFKDLEVYAYVGLLVAAGTPPAIVQRLNTELAAVLKTPEVREKLVAQGLEVVGSTPEAFGTFFANEMDRWGRVVKQYNVKAGD